MRLPIVLVMVVLVQVSVASGQVTTPRAYELAVTFRPQEHFMQASAEAFFGTDSMRTGTIRFYLHGELAVDSVLAGSRRLKVREEKIFYFFDYSLVANAVRVELDTIGPTSSISIFYSGHFNPSRARSASDYMRIDDDGVFLRGYAYSLWFPVFVESGTSPYVSSFRKVRIQTPREYRSVFVGTKMSDVESDDTRVSEWTADAVDMFSVQLTARRYSVTQSGSDFFYSLPDAQSLRATSRVLEFARRLDSLYTLRFKGSSMNRQLHVLQMPQFGDIASSNVVGISDAVWHEFGSVKEAGLTLAHELVHSFVQRPLSIEDSLYALVMEGFPSYFHYPVLAEVFGEEFYARSMVAVEKSYLRKRVTGKDGRGNKLPPEKPITEISAREIGEYKDVFVLNDRVRLFFDFTRRVLGTERFWHFINDVMKVSVFNYHSLEQIYARYFTGSERDFQLWMKTTEYPERFRIVR